MTTRQTRRQVRGFVISWTLITLMMGMIIFLAIYFTARQPDIASPQQIADTRSNDIGPAAIIASNTPRPTSEEDTQAIASTPVPTDEPAAPDDTADTDNEAQAVAQAPTDPPPPTPEPTAIPPTPVPPDEDETFTVGTQLQVPQDLNADVLNGYLRTVKQDLGVSWIKKQVRWEQIEMEEDVYDWAELDLLMAGARFFDVKVMFSVVTAPDWSRQPGVDLEEHGPPADYADYVEFVRKLLERYPGQVYAIEVWNEQNLSREWTSVNNLNATDYVEMLRQTYNEVQATSPGTIVISGALAPTGVDDGIGAIDDFRYMNLMIDAGMLDVTDCVGVHHNGYNISPLVRYDEVPNDPTAQFRGPFDGPHHSWSFRTTLEGYAQRISAAGYDTKLCVTEFGWAVAEDIGGYPPGFEFAADNTLEEQAQFLTDALEFMQESGFVWQAYIWNFNYGPQAGWDTDNDNVPYSLIGPGNTFRPAYDAVREWIDNNIPQPS